MSRQGNGDGSIYQRKDGLWIGAAYVTTTTGARKRIYVSGTARSDVRARLNERIRLDNRGLPSPDRRWAFGAYLDYYMESVAHIRVRRTTYVRYQYIASKYLRPTLGSADLQRLSVSQVQQMLNTHQAAGASARTLHHVRALLRSVLSHAEREEQVARNVAKLVRLPSYNRKPIEPWSPSEVLCFLDAAKSHRWYGAFLMLLAYGMRRGEVLGLTWDNVSLERGTIQVVTQLQRIDTRLQLTEVKTAAGNRTLPIIGLLHEVLAGMTPADDARAMNVVFTSATGTPIDPKNFVRAFHRVREEAGLRRITVHHTRHTAATALKNLGVPARDTQMILGHADISTTQQIYQHSDLTAKREALTKVERVLASESAAALTAAPTAFFHRSKHENSCSDLWYTREDSNLRHLVPKLLFLTGANALTSVSQHLQTRSRTLVLARIAALTAAPGDQAHQRFAEAQTDREFVRQFGGAVAIEQLRNASFPYSLLPTAA